MNNDRFAQYIRAYTEPSNYRKNKRQEEVLSCDHEFVILEKGNYVGSFHSSDCEFQSSVIECVHCGVTNKFMKMTEELNLSLSSFSLRTPFESKLFEMIFPDTFSLADINLISYDELPSDYPRLLYDVARSIKPAADNQELFDVMMELHHLQTPTERLKTCTIEDAQPLIERYKEYHKTIAIQKQMK